MAHVLPLRLTSVQETIQAPAARKLAVPVRRQAQAVAQVQLQLQHVLPPAAVQHVRTHKIAALRPTPHPTAVVRHVPVQNTYARKVLLPDLLRQPRVQAERHHPAVAVAATEVVPLPTVAATIGATAHHRAAVHQA